MPKSSKKKRKPSKPRAKPPLAEVVNMSAACFALVKGGKTLGLYPSRATADEACAKANGKA